MCGFGCIKKDMNKIDYYFIGAGGVSMSALCLFLLEKGYRVAGSDRAKSEVTASLQARGIEVFRNPCLKAVEESETVVYSMAISDNDDELMYARKLGKRVLSRGELLGEIARQHQNVIAISGAHGKTTSHHPAPSRR